MNQGNSWCSLRSQIMSVHIFACIFYYVKKSWAESPEDVESFYNSRNVEMDVSF